jgi:hypothetical protein
MALASAVLMALAPFVPMALVLSVVPTTALALSMVLMASWMAGKLSTGYVKQ